MLVASLNEYYVEHSSLTGIYGIHSVAETELHPFPPAGVRGGNDSVLLGPVRRTLFRSSDTGQAYTRSCTHWVQCLRLSF
jgi:hypothetical protein